MHTECPCKLSETRENGSSNLRRSVIGQKSGLDRTTGTILPSSGRKLETGRQAGKKEGRKEGRNEDTQEGGQE
jgi:hypothetical protein